MRGVERDDGSADRPQYTVAMVSRAPEEHFAAKSGRNSAVDHDLDRQFAELKTRYDAADNGSRLTPKGRASLYDPDGVGVELNFPKS